MAVNKVIILGNVGRTETRATKTGDRVTTVSIATSFKTNDGNQITEWHQVVFFKRLAEIAAQYVVKGSKIYIEGSLKTEKWQTQSGEDRYTTKIIAKELQLLDKKEQSPHANHAQQSLPMANQDPWEALEEIPF